MFNLEGLVINGWNVFAHPIFLDQLEFLINEVGNLIQLDPLNYRKKNNAKRLAAIARLIFEDIPADPTAPIYRQGNTRGTNYKHWFRAKFFQQYRLFFRYNLEAKIIIFSWVNDECTKKAYDSKNDAYLVFSKMLQNGHPPDEWEDLLAESKKPESIERLRGLSVSNILKN